MAHGSVSSETTIRELFPALVAADAAHGAVAASSVAAGMGVSLLLMVARLPTTRVGSLDDRKALLSVTTDLLDVQRQLLATLDADTTGRLVAARAMRRADETQRTARDAAIQLALRAAADIPLDVMRVSAHGLELAAVVAVHGCRAALSDMELAVALLRAGLIGARGTLEVKLRTLTEGAYTQAVVQEMARLSDKTTRAGSAAESALRVLPA
jgi:formiminotetrahydrofolate cyclodeaminase